MTRRVLMVAYYFPPLRGIGSVRATKFAEHLPEFGWEPTVLAPSFGPDDEDVEDLPVQNVVRSRSIELSRIGKRALSVGRDAGATGSHAGGAKGLLRSAAHRYLYRPDAQIGWYPGAVWAG